MSTTLSARLGAIPDSAVSCIISAAMRAAWPDAIPMAGGEPTFEMLVNAREAFREFDERALTKYSPFTGHTELVDLVLGKLARVNGIHARAEDVIVVPGGAGALWGALMAVVDPGCEVIVTNPCWEHYHSIIRMVGAQPKTWALFADRMNGEVDFDRLVGSITAATRAVLINTPLNPSGFVFSEAQLCRLIAICEERGVHLICDEEYETFVFGESRHVSPRSLSPNVISLYAMSKSFAVTGARVGYVVARPEVVALIRRAALYSYMYPSSPAQCLSIAILRQDYVGYLQHVRAHYEARMCTLHELLSAVRGIELDAPAGGVYLFPRLPDVDGRNAAYTLIEKDHLLCVPGDVAGCSAAGHVRLFFGLDEAMLTDAAGRISRRFAA